MNISPLDILVVRNPFYSLNKFKDIPQNEEEIFAFIHSLFGNTHFKEAIYLASPKLYYEWEKLYKTEWQKTSKMKINLAILKYYIRSITKCIPFGLFSSYYSYNFRKDIESASNDNIQRYTTLDMHFLNSIVNSQNNDPIFQNCSKYFPNTTLYKVGNQYRFYEIIVDTQSGIRNHKLISIYADKIIIFLIEISEKGLLFNEMLEKLINIFDEPNVIEIKEYLKSVIQSQVLVSEFQVSLNTNSVFKDLLLDWEIKLRSVHNPKLESTVNTLKAIKRELFKIDNEFENEVYKYEKIKNEIKKTDFIFNEQYLFNTVVKRKKIDNINITEDEINRIIEGVKILYSFSSPNPELTIDDNINLENFKNQFRQRYDDQEIPLLIALDPEIGIGYKQAHRDHYCFSSLIDNFNWPNKIDPIRLIQHNKLHDFWIRIFLNSAKNNDRIINLKEIDIRYIEDIQRKQLPSTFSVMFSKNGENIQIISVGNTSALNFFARYGNDDCNLIELSHQICEIEKHANKNQIVVEVLHLPHNRAGNILQRNVAREFEIPILTKSKSKHIIKLNDILISVKNNKIILKSKSLQKEIIPYVSSVHNFHIDTIPVYHLFCDLQSQEKLNNLWIDIGDNIRRNFDYIPRIVYGKNLILSPAMWKISKNEIKEIYDENGKINKGAFENFKTQKRIPRYFNLVTGQDELVIDSENEILLKIIEDHFKKNEKLTISEFFYDNQVLSSSNEWANEIILSFCNNDFECVEHSNFLRNNNSKLKRDYFPGEEWVYYKFYVGASTSNKILIESVSHIIRILKKKKLIEKWFFVRYNDPEYHIRLRLKIVDVSNGVEKTIAIVRKYTKNYTFHKIIWKIELSTYSRELERYQFKNIEESEAIFHHDSEFALNLLEQLNIDGYQENVWLYSIRSVTDYMDGFNLTVQERLDLLSELYNNFSNEFAVDKLFKIEMDQRYRVERNKIDKIFCADKENYIGLFKDHVKCLKSAYAKLEEKNISFFEKKELLGSFIHMHINRLIKSNQRMHELIIYYFLKRYYDSTIARDNQIVN